MIDGRGLEDGEREGKEPREWQALFDVASSWPCCRRLLVSVHALSWNKSDAQGPGRESSGGRLAATSVRGRGRTMSVRGCRRLETSLRMAVAVGVDGCRRGSRVKMRPWAGRATPHTSRRSSRRRTSNASGPLLLPATLLAARLRRVQTRMEASAEGESPAPPTRLCPQSVSQAGSEVSLARNGLRWSRVESRRMLRLSPPVGSEVVGPMSPLRGGSEAAPQGPWAPRRLSARDPALNRISHLHRRICPCPPCPPSVCTPPPSSGRIIRPCPSETSSYLLTRAKKQITSQPRPPCPSRFSPTSTPLRLASTTRQRADSSLVSATTSSSAQPGDSRRRGRPYGS